MREGAMSNSESASRRWRVVGRSVRGAQHVRRQLPNQDALAWWPPDGVGTTVVLAVADGHGSAQSPRSAEGARLAVETAVRVLREELEAREPPGPETLRKLARKVLPLRLAGGWRKAVLSHLKENPWPPRDNPGTLKSLPRSKAANPFLVYGTTLLVTLVTPVALLLLQIGDGDMLTVRDEGVERPLPNDPDLLPNETLSLCASNAAVSFRSAVILLSEATPSLIVVSTDGYANSFRDDASFRRVGSDLLGLIRSEGLEAVEAHLEQWLSEASEQGSGDDVTLGLLYPCQTTEVGQ